MAYVRLDCITLDRNLWLVSGNNGLGYPDIDMGQNPPTPSELVYINNIYPPQSNILVGQLWTQTTNILPIQGNYEPIPPTPSEPIYIEIPIQLSKILENRKSRTSFDSFTVADWIWHDTIDSAISFTNSLTATFYGIIDYKKASFVAPIRHYLTMVEWLDWQENLIADYTTNVLDGNLNIDNSKDIRRTFSMVVNNTNGLYVPHGARTNMGIKVRIKRGIKTSSGDLWWNRGIFVLSNPSTSNQGAEKITNLSGVDKWSLLNGELAGTLTETTVIARGTNIAEAIRAVAEDAGETKFAFDICTEITPYTITKEPGDTRADLIKELALIPSWDIYYDVDGYLRFTPLIDPLQKQVVVDLSVGSTYRKCYISSKYSPEWSKIKNYWKVIGYSDPDTGIIYDGIAQNNNPLSPTNTSMPPNGIGIKSDILSDDNLTTDSLCEQRAGYELRKNLTKIDRSSHEILPLPFLNEGDCVQLEDTNAGIIDDKYEIQSINEPLGLGLMQIECWRCTSVFEVISYDDFQLGVGSWQQLQSGEVDIIGITGNNALRKKTNNDPNGGYRLLDKKATDFDLIVYTRRDEVGTGKNQYSIIDSNGNGYGVGLDYVNNLITFEKRTAWTGTELKIASLTPSLGNWYTLRLIKIASNFVVEIYNGKVLEYINPVAVINFIDSSYTSFDRVAVNGGHVFYTDNITVRKLL